MHKLKRPPPTLKKNTEENFVVKWLKTHCGEDSVFSNLPPIEIELTNEELISFEKKSEKRVEKQVFSILDIKKSNAINIAFSRIKTTDEDLINEILELKLENDNLIFILFTYFPNDEEFTKLEENIKPIDMLTLSSQNLENKLENLSISNLSKRSVTNKFSRGEIFFRKIIKRKKEIYENLDILNTINYLNNLNLIENLEKLSKYYFSILSSIPFKCLILILLKIGNKLNKAEAKAFKISSVESFTRIKDHRNKTLLELGFNKLKVLEPNKNLLVELLNDFKDLEKANEINFNELENEIKKLKSINLSNFKIKEKINEIEDFYDAFLIVQKKFFNYLGEITDEGIKIIYKEAKKCVFN